ncbi:thioredoxin family protein [Candidatus Bipolaricaulota bacterium]|nr:thioredoxin family protein [Candidatus Bipolaricaulota bacterium]
MTKPVWLVWLAFSVLAFCQGMDVVRIAHIDEAATLAPGGATEVRLVAEILPPWHINAHEPSQQFLVPTRLELALPEGISVEERWPEPEIKQIPIFPFPLELYSEEIEIVLVIRAKETVLPGEYEIQGKLWYQACNDEVCLPPEFVPFAIPISVVASASTGGTPAQAQRFADRSFLGMLSAAFLVGLGLNLTPCVYPMVPVTVGYFAQAAGAHIICTLGLALVYLFGIALTYSALGVLAALGGGMLGQALQHPAVLSILAAVMVALSLSFFGLYTFRAPAALLRKLPKGKGGIVGALLMGMVVGLVAAPCVGPATVAFITYVASLGDPGRGFFLFFALALGLGLPYVGLALLSGKLKKLPKAGTWTVWVEHLLGFFLLGMALYFLSPILPEVGRKVGVVVLSLGGGAFLLFSAIKHRKGWVLPALGALTLAAGLGIAVWSMIPSGTEGPEIPWVKYTPEVLDQAKAEGKPVILYFSAAWCLPCQELSATTFRSQKVLEAVKKTGAIPVKVDLTTVEPEEETVRKNFGVVGVPTVVLLGPEGQELKRLVGLFQESVFLEALVESFGPF